MAIITKSTLPGTQRPPLHTTFHGWGPELRVSL
jgi:hypothetical protein